MTISNEDKQNIMHGLLRIIYHIANKTYQQRIWVEGLGLECDDFSETVNNFFSLFDADLLEKYSDFELTQTQSNILKKFRTEFEAFCETSTSNLLEKDLIETPEWEKIMIRAKEVLEAFN